jgi:hypothetical protein
MRLSRDDLPVPPSRSQPIRASTTPATPGAVDAAKSGRAKTSTSGRTLAQPDEGPASSECLTEAVSSVSTDEPALVAAPNESTRARSQAERLSTEVPADTGRRSSVWIALVGVLLLAAAGGTFYVVRTRGANADKQTRVEPQRDPATVPNQLLEPFRPPDLNFAITRIFAPERLRVMAPEGWDVEDVLRAHREGHEIFAQLLQRKGLADDVPLQPLSIAIVPARLFCYPQVYEAGVVPADCKEREVYYRPMERTLLLVDDREYFEVNLAYGNATAVCLHTGDKIPACLDTVPEIDAEFEKRRERKGKGDR